MAQQQKISRKELLKDDQIVEHAPDIVDWLEKNRGLVIRMVGAAVVVVAAVGVWNLWSNSRRDAAAALLDEGLKAYRPAAATGATQPPPPRLTEALAALEKAAERGGSSGVGVSASFYRASVLVDLGRPAEAVPILEGIVATAPTAALGGSARALLAIACEKAGDGEKAAAALQQLASDATGVFPADVALVRLAELRERQGKAGEAKQAYQDILARFPDGSVAEEARAAVQRLEGAAQ